MSAGFILDLHRCVGCGACVLACRIENGRTTTMAWRRVLSLNLRRYDAGPTYFLSVACHHCERPACLEGCPSGAYEKRADGIVIHHEDRCIGCRYCEMTCPFGTPQFDADRGLMSKCHLCAPRLDAGRAPRLDAGREPACVVACPTEALRYAADVDAPDAGSDRLRQGCGGPPKRLAKAEDPAYINSAAIPRARWAEPVGPAPVLVTHGTVGAGSTQDVARGLQTPGPSSALPPRRLVPGFADPAGCAPNLRFTAPAGADRTARFEELEERLRT
jgi:Fe-S-cluster-containing dehydrogenase component